jgi:hypothetical protein
MAETARQGASIRVTFIVFLLFVQIDSSWLTFFDNLAALSVCARGKEKGSKEFHFFLITTKAQQPSSILKTIV